MSILRRIASKLPDVLQQELKRARFAFMVRKNRRMTAEPEYDLVEEWLNEGDWVLDIGANIGAYSMKFSELVGKTGRVIAVEPISNTFSLLASNSTFYKYDNMTLLNIAASDRAMSVGMDAPNFVNGLKNYYEAHITENNPTYSVYCLPIDNLDISHKIKLVKIDAEGHDFKVIIGMQKLIKRDEPILIIENDSEEIKTFLSNFGYSFSRNDGSPNLVFIK